MTTKQFSHFPSRSWSISISRRRDFFPSPTPLWLTHQVSPPLSLLLLLLLLWRYRATRTSAHSVKKKEKKKREQTQTIILRRALFPPPPPLLITAIAGCGFRSPPLRHCLRNLLSRRRCRRRLIFSSKTEGLESSFISTITSHSETSVSLGRFGCVVGDCFE